MPGRKEPGAFCQEGIRNGAVCCAQQCGACTDGPDPDDDELEIECAARPGGPERCCPSVIRERGETCTATQRDGCVVQGANNATLQLCYWLQHEHGCDYEKWPACASGECKVNADPAPPSMCIDAEMRAAAAARRVDRATFEHEILSACLSYAGETSAPWIDPIRLRERVMAARSRRGAACAEPATVVAGAVKDQSRFAPYWVAWHLLLGVSRVWVYDNDSQSASALRSALAPFEATGLVERIPMPGHFKQMASYEDAVGRAKELGAEFVAAIDLDELIVPFADGCIPSLMRRCTAGGGCGGVQLNRRNAYGGGVELSLAHQMRAWALRASGMPFGSGLELTTKAIVRASSHRRFRNHHGSETMGGFCLKAAEGDDSACASHWQFRDPPSADVAFVYHRHCSSLLNWVVKKSSSAVPAGCPVCFGSLDDIARSYADACFPERIPDHYDYGMLHDQNISAMTLASQRSFVMRMDEEIEALLAPSPTPDELREL